MLNLYRGCAQVSCFDGEGEGSGNPDKTFTQEEVNRILAEDKRKHQATLQKTEQTYKELLESNKSLTEAERKTLQQNLDTVQGQLRSKEEQAALERKQLEDTLTGRIKDTEARASEWEGRYKTETVARSLQDAASSNDAFQPAQIVALLKPMTRLVEDLDETGKKTGLFKIVVDFPDVDPKGNPTTTVRTPSEAVKRMKELPGIYGNLFKSNVVSGIGSNSATGTLPGNGKVNLRDITTAQYLELREKNPAALGLKPLNNGRR